MGLETRQQLLDLSLDQIADLPELIIGQLLRIGDVPFLSPSGPHERASISASHRHGHIDFPTVELIERFRLVIP
jgi:hypothetical protein